MSIFTLCGACFVCVVAVLVIKENRAGSIAVAVSVLCSLMVIGAAITGAAHSADRLIRIVQSASAVKYSGTVLKAFAVAFVVEISADTVRDLGSDNVARALEFAGKGEILVLSIDPICDLLGRALSIIGQA